VTCIVELWSLASKPANLLVHQIGHHQLALRERRRSRVGGSATLRRVQTAVLPIGSRLMVRAVGIVERLRVKRLSFAHRLRLAYVDVVRLQKRERERALATPGDGS
jgi:hypothetical protein